MGKLQAILFDLDGTVTDSAGIVSEAMQAMYLAQTGRELPVESFYKYLGPPLEWSFRDLGATPEQVPVWISDYRARYLQKMPLTPLFPGIKELLTQLARSGFTLGVATSKNTKYAIEVCTYTDVRQYFAEIFGASEDGRISTKAEVIESALNGFTQAGYLAPVKDAPFAADGYREDVVMIGDRIHDIEGAAAHQIHTILVGWGKAPDTERAQAWQIAQSPAELFTMLRKLAPVDKSI